MRMGKLIAARVAKTTSAAIGILIKLRDQLPLHDFLPDPKQGKLGRKGTKSLPLQRI